MVERPIKKSERLARAAEMGENPETQPSESQERSGNRDRRGGKGKRRGKDDRQEGTKPPVNPALMRGPRPPRATEVVEEPVAAEPEGSDSDATAEPAEGVESATVDSTVETPEEVPA